MTSNLFDKLKLNRSQYWFIAHHPVCDRYSNHLIFIKGYPFCLGCTFMYLGVLFGVVVVNLIPWNTVSFATSLSCHLLLLLPTAIQPWIQYKFFKKIARFILGVTISSYLISSIFYIALPFTGWLYYPLVFTTFGALSLCLIFLRNRFTKNPCRTCPTDICLKCDQSDYMKRVIILPE